METLNIKNPNSVVGERISQFVSEIINAFSSNIHSIYVIGSSVTDDFDQKSSDINTLFVLNKMDFAFIKFLAQLGKKYKKKGITVPLIMTPEYIQNSLDVFPIEYLDLQLIHKTIYGVDLLKELKINKSDLRLQTEREIKTRLIRLRQGYISSMGDIVLLKELIFQSISGYITIFRAIIHLFGLEAIIKKHDVILKIQEITKVNTQIFEKILLIKRNEIKISKEEVPHLYEQYYYATESLIGIINELQA